MKMGLGGDLDTNWLSKRKRRGKRGQDRGQRWMSGEVGGVKGGWWCNMSSGVRRGDCSAPNTSRVHRARAQNVAVIITSCN